MMNKWTIVLVLAMLTTICLGQTQPDRPAGKTVATTYFETITKGDAAGATAVAAAPFSFDRKEILKTIAEVAEKHQKIAAKKGHRDVPEYTVSLTNEAPALDHKVFPEYEVYRITIAGKGDQIDIYVSKAEAPKVIGFSD